MRPVFIIAAVLSFSPVFFAQSQLHVQVADAGGNGDWKSETGPWLAAHARVRFTALKGSWCHLLSGASITGESENVPSWLNPVAPVDPAAVELEAIESSWSGPSFPRCHVPATTFATMLTCGLESYYAGGANPYACQDWMVPILDDTQSAPEGMRIWNSRPLAWLSTNTGSWRGPMHSAIWDGMLADSSSSNNLDTETFSAEAMFRTAALYQALISNNSLDDANAFFDGGAYKSAVANSRLRLDLQGMTAISTDPGLPPAGTSDENAPALVGHPLFHPATSLTPKIGITVIVPNPTSGDPIVVDGGVSPGEWIRFRFAGATAPVIVRFASCNPVGHVDVVAASDADQLNPLRYKVRVPPNVGVGQVQAATGLHPTFFGAGQVTSVNGCQ